MYPALDKVVIHEIECLQNGSLTFARCEIAIAAHERIEELAHRTPAIGFIDYIRKLHGVRNPSEAWRINAVNCRSIREAGHRITRDNTGRRDDRIMDLFRPQPANKVACEIGFPSRVPG